MINEKPPSPKQTHYGDQFSPAGFQTRINASTLQVYKTCPRKYQLNVLLGEGKDEASPDLRFGTLLHEAKAIYKRNRAAGGDHNFALQGAFRYLLHATWSTELGRSNFSTDPTKNRATLLRTFVWYVDNYNEATGSDPFETVVLPSGKPAVELKFEFPTGITAPDGTPVTFVGTLDELGQLGSQVFVGDTKTSKSAWFLTVDNYAPDGQFSLYALAAWVCFGVEVQGVILDGVEVTPTGSKFHRLLVPRTLAGLEEWWRDQKVWIRRMMESFVEDSWPQNDAVCGLYGGCKHRRRCSGRDLALEEREKEND